MASTLHVQLLGGLRLDYGGAPVTTVDTARMQSMLAYLILHRDAPQPRRHVAFVLWPDSAEGQALTNSRHVLHLLRHALPDFDTFVDVESQSVQWRPDAPATIDVVWFEAAGRPDAAEAELRRAAELYHGELLPSCYDEWIVPHRDRLHAAFAGVLGRLIHLCEAERDYPGAIGYARRLLEIDPLEEESYRLLMRLHALNDDRAAALHVYHSCVSVLERELDVQPGAATRELYEELLAAAGPARPGPARSARLPLAGRKQEWARLQAEWHAAAAGGPRLVTITGEPGIGKTRLAEEMADWAAKQGITTAWARCYASGAALAYAPVVDWLRALPLPRLDDVWLAEVARLLPELAARYPHLPAPGPLAEAWQRRRMFEALARAVTGSGRRLLLVLDDIQWCDPDTLNWLAYLLQFDRAARLMVVVTLRSNEPLPTLGRALGELAAGLQRVDRAAEIALEPLDPDDTQALASIVAGRPLDAALADRLHRGSEGNPLFVVEMVRAGLGRERPLRIGLDHGLATTGTGLELPEKVRQIIEARLGQLSPAAGDLARLAAVAGRQFSPDVLRQASGLTEEALVQALDELWQRRIVREEGTSSYSFSHERLSEVAYAGLSLARRRLMHRQVAHALETVHAAALDPVSGQVATHYERAGQLDRAALYLRRAAAAARRVLAIGEAVELLRRAIALAPGLPSAPDLHEELADLLQVSGSLEEARAALSRAAELLPPCRESCVDRARLWRKTADSWMRQLEYDEAARAFAQAGTVLGEAPAAGADGDGAVEWWQEWAQIRLELMDWHYWQANWQSIAALAEEVRPTLDQYGSPHQHSQFYHDLVRMALRRDRYTVRDETLSWSNAAMTIASGLKDEVREAGVEFNHGFVQLWRGNLDSARRSLDRSLAVAERVGDGLLKLRSQAYLSIWARFAEQPAEVEHYLLGSARLSRALHSPNYEGVALANRAWLAWRAGHAGEATAKGGAALDLLTPYRPPYPFEWLARWPLLALALDAADADGALGHARRMLDVTQQRLPAPLGGALERAVSIAEAYGAPAALEALSEAVELACQLHYL